MPIRSIAAEGRDTKRSLTPTTQLTGNSRHAGSLLPDECQTGNKIPGEKRTQPLIQILICDDDPADRRTIRACVQRITDRHFVLWEAGQTDEVCSVLDKGRIDLVLMGSQVLAKSGMEWLAGFAAKQLVPVVILSDPGTEEIVNQAFQHGAVGHLPMSSLSPDRLKDIIDIALHKWARLHQAIAPERKLERLATFDSSTGLYNRHAILAKLHEMVNLANGNKEDFSLIMLDIDHLQEINDHYGHLAGDEVLAGTATLIRRYIRDTDVLGRYEGEELIIILPKTTVALSWVVAERLRSTVEKTRIKDSAGRVFYVTVSQGLAGWERGENGISLVCRADEALYRAKEKGRNRVQMLFQPSLRDRV
jgi:diguanylate cyclase (GGDEF)-like protein